jgi:hypothetical protein
LNFNDFYSHNKIQEHFITPRKVCNDMNAIIKYLFKYINYRILFFFGKIGCYNSYHSWWLISNWSHQLSFQPNTRVNEFIPLFYHSNQTRGRMNSSLTSRMIPFHPSLTLNQTHPKWLDYVPQLRCLVEMSSAVVGCWGNEALFLHMCIELRAWRHAENDLLSTISKLISGYWCATNSWKTWQAKYDALHMLGG